MLYCPNYTCQTPNPEGYKFCQKCRTPLPHHYLWAVGESAELYRPGDLLGDRFLCKSPRLFLDTKPGLYTPTATDIPPEFVAYLRLSPYKIHIPQVYEIVSSATSQLLLLDHAALDRTVLLEGTASDRGEAIAPQILPALSEGWTEATALRQLNWLWQLAHLWQPLSSQQVTSTVFTPELLRVEGSVLRLLELQSDGAEPRTLKQLGQLWSTWVKSARPEIAKALTQVCQQLVQGQIRNAEQLIEQLDALLAQVGRSRTSHIEVATRTDQGPSRQRNEDACYPAAGTIATHTIQAASERVLVIVCDGIGGHQGGDVASNLAIQSLYQQVEALPLDTLDAPSLMVALEEAVCVANDVISRRNDNEQRSDRQRMGTTLVMAVARGHELYITHVGDSRVYWVRQQGCYQVTQDDDVASREVRLGYSVYREAVQQPGAGSLVQALGMGPSTILHPTVQRFILDEDSVFLLCSDGLSDNDRVEEYWDTVLLPILTGKAEVGKVSQQLIELANSRNGHDNVTVGILYARAVDAKTAPVKTGLSTSGTATLIQDRQSFSEQGKPSRLTPLDRTAHDNINDTHRAIAPAQSDIDPAIAKTQVLPAYSAKKFNALPLLLGIMLLTGGGALLAYSLSLSFRGWVDSLLGSALVSSPTPSSTAIAPSTPIAPPTPLQIGSFLQINPVTTASTPLTAMVVLSEPRDLQPPVVDASLVPAGSVVQILGVRATNPQERWVQLRVCSLPAGAVQSSSSRELIPQASASSFSPVSLPATPTDPATQTVPNGAIAPSPTSGSPAGTGLASPPLNPSTVPTPEILSPGGVAWVQEPEVLRWASLKTPLTSQEGVCVASPAPVTSGEVSFVNPMLDRVF